MIREVGNRWGRLRARQDELDILLADMHRRRKTRAKLRRARSGEFAARNSMSGGRRAGCYFTEDVRADFRAQNRLDFRRIVRIGVVMGWPRQSRPLKGSPRDLRGFGWCERQVRRREPTEPEYVNPFHREVPKP
jgi:hypothetical protein